MGIEEEYLLVERDTGARVSYQPQGLIEKVKALRHGLVSPELFSCQIEIGTPVCDNLKDLRAEIGLLRIAVSEAAADYGLAPIASSTHPFTRWETQQVTDGDRYRQLADDLQGTARQLVISGLHVHVGIEDPALRLEPMQDGIERAVLEGEGAGGPLLHRQRDLVAVGGTGIQHRQHQQLVDPFGQCDLRHDDHDIYKIFILQV